MIQIDDVIKEWEKDSEINKQDAGNESIGIAKLHSKYYKFLIQAKKQFRNCCTAYNKLSKVKTEYYLGLLSKEELNKLGWEPFSMRVLRQDIQLYLDADSSVCKAGDAVEEAKVLVEFIESILKDLNQRNFQIRNLIEWNKFINGIS